jgi:hypothetical protein
VCQFTVADSFPPQLAGLLAAAIGMGIGSLTPQVLKNHHNKTVHLHA